MLKPLVVFQTDASGAVVLDRNGDPIPLANPQPKKFEDYSPDERASWERQLSEDKEWRMRAERKRLEDDILLTAARLVASEARER